MARILVAAALFLLSATGASAADLHATTSNFSSVFASAQPGDRVLMASGDYGSWAGGTKASPGVTLTPESGSTPSMRLAWDTIGSPAWLILDGLQINSNSLISGPTHDVTIKNSHFVGYTQLNPGASPGANNACGDCPAMNDNHIVFDGNLFDLSACPSGSCLGYEGRLSIAYGSATSAGITIKNNVFRNNCADGIQVVGGDDAGRGVTVGPGNEFTNLYQGSCAPHVDSVQFVGGGWVHFTGNYFHDDDHGIVNYDATPANVEVTDNVFSNLNSDTIAVCSSSNLLVEHNTVKAPANNYNCVNHSGTPATGTVWRNNIQNGPPSVQGASSYAVNDYNLCTVDTCAGSHSLNGMPTYTGGSSPTTYAGFQLTSGSLGHQAGSDGLDMGVRYGASAPAPQCSDGVDNDGDLLIDYPADPGCASASDNDETDAPPPPLAQCSDGLDNDSDGLIDYPADPGCTSASDDSESPNPPPDNLPTARFTASPNPSTTGQQVTFDASSTTCVDTPCSYAWEDDGPDGPGGTQWSLGTGQTLQFTFTGAGTKYVRLIVTDVDGDIDTVEHDQTVNAADTTPPDTTITGQPANPTTSTSATFSFTATETGSTFECKLDAGAYAACTSSKTYDTLATGSHTFSVRATDAANNTDASPATYTWTINGATVTPPTFVAEAESSWSSATTPKTVSLPVQAGDVLVAYGMSEDAVDPMVIGGNQSWTLRQSVVVSAYATNYAWTATATSTGTATVTFTRTAGTGFFGGDVLQFRGSGGVGASTKANVSSGAPSLAITTTSANSAVAVANVDWAALSGTSRIWRTTAGAFTEKTYSTSSGRYTVYGGYHANVGAAGAKTVGLSSPSGEKYSVTAVEVKGT